MHNMHFHETPVHIGRILARHAPREIYTLLDPAVGRGALIEAIIGRLDGSLERFVCLDTDQTALEHVYHTYAARFGKALELINSDFLQWPLPHDRRKTLTFDCIVMNPPFSGKLNGWVQFTPQEPFSTKSVHMPIEAAFVLKALSLLRDRGRLLAVVPSSLISSEKLLWVRRCMFNNGSLDYVYELPRFTFKGVETRPYLIVVTKGSNQRGLRLLQMKGNAFTRLLIDSNEVSCLERCDYHFYEANRLYESLKLSCPGLHWLKVDEVIEIHRGRISSPIGKEKAIHTTAYRDGFWKAELKMSEIIKDHSLRGIREGDLLIKRVGRNCFQSIGLPINLQGLACSDCVLILRPRQGFDSVKILIALRCILCSAIGRNLLERGTGASYLTAGVLKELSIPVLIADVHAGAFNRYLNATSTFCSGTMISIERELRIPYGIPELQ